MKRSTKQSVDVLGTLVAERQKYEQWIAALESKKASTPPKVYERVHADYVARLAGVMEELGARSAELEAQRGSLKSRSDELGEQENVLREERAEAELRNTVGEYTPEQWQDVARKSDEGIAKISAERGRIDAELESLERILVGISSTTSPGAKPVADEKDAAPVETHTGDTDPRGQTAQPVAAAATAPKPAAPAPAPAAPSAPAASVSGTPLGFPASGTVGSPAASPSDSASSPPAAPPSRPSFDELAFLKSVVPEGAPDPNKDARKERKRGGSQPDLGVVEPTNTGERARYVAAPTTPGSATPSGEGRKAAAPASSAPAQPDTPPSTNAAEPRVPSKHDPTLQRGPAAPIRSSRQVNAAEIGALGIENLSEGNVAKNETPTFLKNVPSEQPKSLKCGECGAMNYATEWYCERCGAELSAL